VGLPAFYLVDQDLFNLRSSSVLTFRPPRASVTDSLRAMHNQQVYVASKAAMIGLALHCVRLSEIWSDLPFDLTGWIETDTQSKIEAAQGLQVPLGRSGSQVISLDL
jgi:hypothetical protein